MKGIDVETFYLMSEKRKSLTSLMSFGCKCSNVSKGIKMALAFE